MLVRGLLAGAAGTAALEIVSYGDMLSRGRARSGLPARVVQKLAARAGFAAFAAAGDDVSQNRRSALGALFGYGVGLGAAVVYAYGRPRVERWLPWPIAGVMLGAGTLVASEGSATALGATDWRTWSVADWISDIVPRTIYGLTAAWVVDALDVW